MDPNGKTSDLDGPFVNTPSHGLTSGIILAGTFPWANSTFDRLSPRPLVPVAHRSLISFGLSWLEGAGIRSIAVCGNRNSRGLEAQLRRQCSADVELSYLEDAMPRGAGGCVRDAALMSDSRTFVVTDGAAIPNVDLDDLLRAHQHSGAAATVVVYPESSCAGHITLHVPAGVYVFDRRALESISRRGFVDIKEHLIRTLVKAGERVVSYTSATAMPRVLNAKTYLAANEFVTQLVASCANGVPAGYALRGEALVHTEASIGPDVILAGPVLVAAGATILPRAVIIGPTSIGCDVTIGVGALVSRSAVWRRSRVLAGAVVDRSIIADDAVVIRERHAHRAVVVGGKPHGRWRGDAQPWTGRDGPGATPRVGGAA